MPKIETQESDVSQVAISDEDLESASSYVISHHGGRSGAPIADDYHNSLNFTQNMCAAFQSAGRQAQLENEKLDKPR